MLSARLGHPDRALLSSPVLPGPCCHQFALVINLARALSPTGRFNKVRVASEGLAAAKVPCPALSSKASCVCPPACGTGSSSCWEGACSKHSSVSPANLHPTAQLVAPHLCSLFVSVWFWHLFIFPHPPPALGRGFSASPAHSLVCVQHPWGPCPSHSNLLPPVSSGGAPPS